LLHGLGLLEDLLHARGLACGHVVLLARAEPDSSLCRVSTEHAPPGRHNSWGQHLSRPARVSERRARRAAVTVRLPLLCSGYAAEQVCSGYAAEQVCSGYAAEQVCSGYAAEQSAREGDPRPGGRPKAPQSAPTM